MPITLNPVQQTSGFCGPASLAILLDFYGVKMSQRQLGDLCGTTSKYGTEPEMLLEALSKLGFSPIASEHGSWETLKDLIDRDIPVLVNWWSDYDEPADGHYSVVYKMTDSSIYIMDPELGGSRRMSKSKFLKNWYDFYASGKKNTAWYMYIPQHIPTR
jgi:ABC-type bacteriocin/lantibiotic exporter with double-glycine peptidase domain